MVKHSPSFFINQLFSTQSPNPPTRGQGAGSISRTANWPWPSLPPPNLAAMLWWTPPFLMVKNTMNWDDSSIFCKLRMFRLEIFRWRKLSWLSTADSGSPEHNPSSNPMALPISRSFSTMSIGRSKHSQHWRGNWPKQFFQGKNQGFL